jgi:dCTP deaminase
MSSFSLLTDNAIVRHRELGNIVIEPFDPKHLGTTSYDVCLGDAYFRESKNVEIFNPRSKASVLEAWQGPFYATPLQKELTLENISSTDKVIWLEPGESILAHTNEFIGSRRKINTTMQARSSIGRSFLVVCRCAGFGDIGYHNRWTMEIVNCSRYHTIPLVVGQRIAQIVFNETEGTAKCYSTDGKYQSLDDLEIMKAQWKPDMMLPRIYMDFEQTTTTTSD